MITLNLNFTSSQFVKGKKFSREYIKNLIQKQKKFFTNKNYILRKKQLKEDEENKKFETKRRCLSKEDLEYFKPEKLRNDFILTSFFDDKKYLYKEISSEKHTINSKSPSSLNQKFKKQRNSLPYSNSSNDVLLPNIKVIFSQGKFLPNVTSLKKQTITNRFMNDKNIVMNTRFGSFNTFGKHEVRTNINNSNNKHNSLKKLEDETNIQFNIRTMFPKTTKNQSSKNEMKLLQQQFDGKLYTYYSLSVPGTKMGTKKENQDTMLVFDNLMNDNSLYLFGIFDGHGDHGKNISEISCEFIKEYFLRQTENNQNKELFNKENIFKAISDLVSYIKTKTFLDLQFSGTTLNTIFIDNKNNILHCANVGDSRAIAITLNDTIIPLSMDHKPDKPLEKKRIQSQGGEIDRVNWANTGPLRVWLKGKDYPGLSISRSIGDLIVEHVGVTSEPDIKEINIYIQQIKIVVLASDGLWEFLPNERVKEIVNYYYNNNYGAKNAVHKLLNESRLLWEIKNPQGIDDISIIVIFFK